MGSNTGVRHERQEVSSTDSPRVEGSSPVRGRVSQLTSRVEIKSNFRNNILLFLFETYSFIQRCHRISGNLKQR